MRQADLNPEKLLCQVFNQVLGLTKGQLNQKLYYINYTKQPLFDIVKCLCFLVETVTPKRHFEIN